MLRVWFNHWFSTSYRLTEVMQEHADKKICIIGSNMRKNSVIQKVCDEWYEEPTCEGEEYINYCLDFCKDRQIDVFVPRRNMLNISQNINKFNQPAYSPKSDSTYRNKTNIKGTNISPIRLPPSIPAIIFIACAINPPASPNAISLE